MAGRIVRVVPKRKYDFSAVAANSTLELNVADHIESQDSRELTLLARVHSINTNYFAAVSNVMMRIEAPTTDDADFDVVGSFTLYTNHIASTTPSGRLLLASATLENVGSRVRVFVRGVQGAAQPTIFNVTLSVDLLFKS